MKKAMKAGLVGAPDRTVSPASSGDIPMIGIPQSFGSGFLRFPEVRRRTGLSRTTLWRLESAGAFPSRRQISRRAVAWLESEVESWIASRRQIAATVTP